MPEVAPLKRLERILEGRGELIVALAALVLALIAAHGRSTPYNNYALLADAFVHGRLAIDYPGPLIDAVQWRGGWYVIEGPVPALIMLPFVAILGKGANQTVIAMVLAALAVAAAWELLRRLGLGVRETAWLCAFFFAGTTLWWCAMLGDVWFIAHCCAVAFTMFALRELTGPSPRGWLVALLGAAAAGSRFTLLLALPFYAYFLWRGGLASQAQAPATAERSARLRGFALTLIALAGLWVWYNLARWGVWWDIGYLVFFHRDPWGQPAGSPFRLSYFPYEFYSFFMQPPALVEWRQQALWPIFKVDVHGVALPWSSPALALAFFARAPRRYLVVMWALIAAVALPSFLYYLNGWYQYGMRHALDFEPYLLVLIAFAVRTGITLWGKVLIGWSIAMSVWGVWYWDAYYRTGN